MRLNEGWFFTKFMLMTKYYLEFLLQVAVPRVIKYKLPLVS